MLKQIKNSGFLSRALSPQHALGKRNCRRFYGYHWRKEHLTTTNLDAKEDVMITFKKFIIQKKKKKVYNSVVLS